MKNKQIFHNTAFNMDTGDYAVRWGEEIICITDSEEKARCIQLALDNYKPYFVEDKD